MQGLKSATWSEALTAAKDALLKFKGSELRFIAGKLADAESLIALKANTRHLSYLSQVALLGLWLPWVMTHCMHILWRDVC
jgi:hypothetical protein